MVVDQPLFDPIPCKTLFGMPAGEAGVARWEIATGQMEIDCVVASGNHRANAVEGCFFIVFRKNGLELPVLLVHDL